MGTPHGNFPQGFQSFQNDEMLFPLNQRGFVGWGGGLDCFCGLRCHFVFSCGGRLVVTPTLSAYSNRWLTTALCITFFHYGWQLGRPPSLPQGTSASLALDLLPNRPRTAMHSYWRDWGIELNQMMTLLPAYCSAYRLAPNCPDGRAGLRNFKACIVLHAGTVRSGRMVQRTRSPQGLRGRTPKKPRLGGHG